MKKLIVIVAMICTIICSFSNIYATNIINETRDNLVNIYDEMIDMDGNMNNTDNDAMGIAIDGLSVGIIVASVIVLAVVIFYYLVPQK